VFSLAVLAAVPDATVLAFEPIPPVFALLERNAAATAGRVVAVPCALGASEGEADFTWYPRLSILSGRHADAAADAATVRAFLGHEAGAGAVRADMLADIAEARLHGERLRCPVTTLSAAIRERGWRRIDLLKIDVEGDEAAVLAGIADEHWQLIDRLLIETQGGSAALEAALTARGYRVAARQAPWAGGTGLHLLTAVHRRIGALPPPRAITVAPSAQDLRTHLARVLPAAMVPATYQMIAALPLSRHGKLDRAALPDPLADPLARPAAPPAGQMPRTPTQQALLAHWRETLGLPVSGVDQDFFAAGGDSLAAARLAGWAQERFDAPIRLRDFLATPTIAGLAALIEAARGAAPAPAIQPRGRPSRPAPLRALT
jgi:FkbM family methyltransferase